MTRKAGSIVLDRLRDRILLGRYFGCWGPGDRLPSVRAVAEAEHVDRKTAAAAYRRLQREGLVMVEPRSGVYLSADEREDGGDPLRRLHQQWLEQTLSTASDLGLQTPTLVRMLQAVAAIEARRIPVIDEDDDHAALMARELASRTGLDCAGCRFRDVTADPAALRDAPFVVATPSLSVRLRPRQRPPRLVQATLSPELLDNVRRRARRGAVAVVVSTDGLARELAQALAHGLVGPPGRIRIVRVRTPADAEGLREEVGQVVVWPGAPVWAAERLNGGGNGRERLLAEQTLRSIRRAVARAAIELVSRSSAA